MERTLAGDPFKRRCENTKDYAASVFPSVLDEVTWNVAGYLLAWRIAISREVGSIRYSAGHSEYLLINGSETIVTIQVLNHQLGFSTKGEPT
ncbi:hypothetical protein BGW36DRAFT_390066 [Talaromyces proteolyticus]|uniref:Uncharacterized protein n=1 Tax=Talaromyces proteolyticus TaxID=1131652 RepID=A0AAD4KFS3_9EURO|nr:uncharacterized protein BGW36DRAFT_390066 [Talaromyces proteolyticus]KAH8690006.1 hypothetical protein BGW36DRAFT_390066 [Talaromyces proteolyticus]